MISSPVLQLVDAGSGRMPGGFSNIGSSWCAREHCGLTPAAGHDFCGPCLAWLRGDEDIDPLTTRPPSRAPSRAAWGMLSPSFDVDDDEWWYGGLIGAISGDS